MKDPSENFSSQSEKNAWVSAAFAVWPWIVPALLDVYIKRCMLSLDIHGGLRIVARSLGRAPSATVSGLSIWERLSFFRMDLLVAYLLIPAGLILLSRFLRRRSRTIFIGLFSAAISIVLCLQLRAFDEVGQFISFDMFRAAITWGLENPSAGYRYLNLRAFVLLGAGIAVIAAAWKLWRGTGLRKHSRAHFTAERLRYAGGAAVVASVVLITALAWASPLPATPFHQSIVVWALRSLADRPDVDTREFQGLSIDRLENRYRSITSAPIAQKNLRYWAKANHCNVLFLVLETAPSRILSADGNLDDFPNLRRLRENSFVGISHYTTYPETHQSIFSIFSSWYPSSLVDVNGEHPDFVSPDVIRKLSEIGYDTAIYSPYDFRGEPDADMYGSLGFERQVYAKDHPIQTSLETRIALDTAALNMLNRDLERDLVEGRQFAYLFAPQVSHGPWLGLFPNQGEGEQEVVRAGRSLLQNNDRYLGEIMQVLERHDQLKRTVIVVVGDHGVRAHQEDPNFTGEIFGEYSFHVPLIIYAPMALDHTEKIAWVTSHIDIAPTVLGLLGIDGDFAQGLPIWDPALANRTTYFFARSLSGADGYHSDGKFFMWNHVSDTVYESTGMNFSTVPPAPHNSALYREVTSSINQMAGLEEVWATRFSQTKSVRNHLYDAASH